MVFWTIQHKKVIDVLNDHGEYYPNFKKSPQLHRNTYNKLLGIFNDLNGSSYEGLIFCIAKDGRTKGSLTFKDEAEFFNYMKLRPGVLQSLNNGTFTLLDNEHLLCRVETNKFDKLFLCLVDFWNFIMMIPDEEGTSLSRDSYEMCRPFNPIFVNIAYEDFVELAWKKMRERTVLRPLMSSTILQATIPYLEKDMLTGTYSVAELAEE